MSENRDWVRWLRPAIAVTVVALAVADMAIGAPPRKEPVFPNYALPNIAAIVMCLTTLVIPCKRFRRS